MMEMLLDLLYLLGAVCILAAIHFVLLRLF